MLLLVLALVAVVGLMELSQGHGMVRARYRAAGVDPRLLAFLDAWEQRGKFPVWVQWQGGVRTDESVQAAAFARGDSRAATLAQTPHGRAGALDVAPWALPPDKVTADDYARVLELAALAEELGLTWGGRWQSAFPPTSANPFGGDLPHFEVPDWEQLPYPPGGA